MSRSLRAGFDPGCRATWKQSSSRPSRKNPRNAMPPPGMMAEDLRCFLDARPIRARPPSTLDRLGKLVRRRPALAGPVGGPTGRAAQRVLAITTLWIDAVRARDEAALAADLARREKNIERRTRYQAGISAAASASRIGSPRRGPVAARGSARRAPQLGVAVPFRPTGQLHPARSAPAEGPIKAFDLAPDGTFFAYAVAGSTDLRLRRTGDPLDFGRLDGFGSSVNVIGFSRDGARIAAALVDGTIRVWQVAGCIPVATLKGKASEIVSLIFDRSAFATPVPDTILAFRSGGWSIIA